jgi:glycerol-3-phosphate dehydrogenase
LGTTDVPVRGPDELAMQAWEIDLLMSEGQVRSLRSVATGPCAWAGIRAFTVRRQTAAGRDLPRAHALLDHGEPDGLPGLLTILGGKLTTFRKMAQDALDLIAAPAPTGESATEKTTLPGPSPRFYFLGQRLAGLSGRARRDQEGAVLCECEAVAQGEVARALRMADASDLDDIRRDLRLGMGPCQARSAPIVPPGSPQRSSRAGFRRRLRRLRRGTMARPSPLAWGLECASRLLRRVRSSCSGGAWRTASG